MSQHSKAKQTALWPTASIHEDLSFLGIPCHFNGRHPGHYCVAARDGQSPVAQGTIPSSEEESRGEREQIVTLAKKMDKSMAHRGQVQFSAAGIRQLDTAGDEDVNVDINERMRIRMWIRSDSSLHRIRVRCSQFKDGQESREVSAS